MSAKAFSTRRCTDWKSAGTWSAIGIVPRPIGKPSLYRRTERGTAYLNEATKEWHRMSDAVEAVLADEAGA